MFNHHKHFVKTNITLTFCCHISGSVMIAWTPVKTSLGLQHALYVGLVSEFTRSKEQDIFKDRFFKVLDPVQGVIDR